MTSEGNDKSSEEPGFTFSDKRRVDPNTGEVRPEADAQSASAGAGEEPTADPNAEQAAAADASDLGVDIPSDASGLEDI